MNAQIIRDNGDVFPVKASWRVIPGNLKDLIVTCTLPKQKAIDLFNNNEIFTLRMNDGREARLFITGRINLQHDPMTVTLAINSMVKPDPD